jgi:hypothetical protein
MFLPPVLSAPAPLGIDQIGRAKTAVGISPSGMITTVRSPFSPRYRSSLE